MKLNSFTPLIILIIAGAGIYWYFFTGTGNQPPLSANKAENQAKTEFQTLVGELTPISFDAGIFSDARFNALVDLMTPIAPEPVGRLDPFAGISNSIHNQSSNATSTVSSSSPSVNKK